MQRSNTFGFVLIVGLALVALVLIFQWQSGGHVSMGSFFGGGDGRTVEKVGGKSVKFKPSDLQVGDTILSINGIEVRSWSEAYKVLEALYQPGLDKLQVAVRRESDEGKVDKKTVELDRDRIKTLVLRGAPGNRKPDVESYKATAEGLYDAAESGNATAVEQILDSGGKAIINEQVNNQTALIAAIGKGNMAVVRVLLDNKADPNKAAADQTTPLMRAAEIGNRDLVAALMVAGADPSLRNSQLQTASDIAGDQGFLDVAEFIENPSPTKFLTSDQKRKIVDPLRDMGFLKSSGYRPSDNELSDAIRSYQRAANKPVSGIVTAESFSDLVKFARGYVGTKNDAAISDTTKKTLSRIFSRALTEQWTPVNSASGYPRCEEESVSFEISADQQTITWKSYRPGVTPEDMTPDMKPTQKAEFKVQWADQREGYDTILVKPNPKPIVGPAYQLWEIRDGYLKITAQARPSSSEATADAGGPDKEDGAMGIGGPSSSSPSVSGDGRSSFLAVCRS